LYGEASMLKIENDNRVTTFTFDIPEEDNRILRDQFDKDELILQAKSFAKAYWAITAILKQMRHTGETEWNAPRTTEWYASSRASLKAKMEARQVTT
jgi:hypothetical protein